MALPGMLPRRRPERHAKFHDRQVEGQWIVDQGVNGKQPCFFNRKGWIGIDSLNDKVCS